MLKVKLKDKGGFFNVSVLGKKTSVQEALALLDTALEIFHEDYGIKSKEAMELLYEFKKVTKSE